MTSPPSTGVPRVQITRAQPRAEHAQLLGRDFASGVLPGGWEGLPESRAVRAMTEAGASPRQVRTWLTFMAAMARARDADRLWPRGADLWLAEPWIYEPEEAAGRTVGQLSRLLRSSGVSQKYGQDARAWHRIARTLAGEELPVSIGDAMESGRGDAPQLLEDVRRSSNGIDQKDLFPLLRGPKISAMWVRQLAYPGGATLERLERVPVAVDTHVKRVTEVLGLVRQGPLDERHRQRVQEVWFDVAALAGSFGAPSHIDATAAGIDPAIWALGRTGCARCVKSRARRPIRGARICSLCCLVDESPLD